VRERPADGASRLQRLYQRYSRSDLDGANNASERLIGWHIKERYRTMRGYRRTGSIRNVVTLTARMAVRSGHYDMTELYIQQQDKAKARG
jgi:hypothetical protein